MDRGRGQKKKRQRKAERARQRLVNFEVGGKCNIFQKYLIVMLILVIQVVDGEEDN